MEAKKPNYSYQAYFDEVSLGLQKIRKSGGCTVITVPKAIVEQLELENVPSAIVILLIRRKKVHTELKDDEEWVKLSKREKIMFEQWKKDRESYIEKSID